MKESIFFNRAQLELIRWYGLLRSIFFDYGLFVISGLVSLVALFFIFSFWVVADSDPESSFATTHLDQKLAMDHFLSSRQKTIDETDGLQAFALGGELTLSWGTLKSLDNILRFDSLILPRLTSLPLTRVASYQKILSEKASSSSLASFFNGLLVTPLREKSVSLPQLKKLPISGDIDQFFNLDCSFGAQRHSFVCKHYINSFLENFMYYDLDSEESFAFLQKLSFNTASQKRFCSGLLTSLSLGSKQPGAYAPLFKQCDRDSRSHYALLKDASSLQQELALSSVSSDIYMNSIFNRYKLLSLQQLLYRQIVSSDSVKTLVESYLNFVYELLIKDEDLNGALLGDFYKSFIHWYNSQILLPYLKDESSSMKKEDKNGFIDLLFSLHHKPKDQGFTGLEAYSVFARKASDLSTAPAAPAQTRNLEELFRGNYLPQQFILTSLSLGEEDDTLQLKGVDRKTELNVAAVLLFDGLRFYVDSVTVEGHAVLSEYVELLVKGKKKSFADLLLLLAEHLTIEEQTEVIDHNLCQTMGQVYGTGLVACWEDSIRIEKGEVRYDFVLEDARLKSFQVSDKPLEQQLLLSLDLSRANKGNTQYLISSIVAHQFQDKDDEFGMGDRLIVTEKFFKHFMIAPDNVVSSGEKIKIFFKLKEIDFIGYYDVLSNTLSPIAFDPSHNSVGVFIKGFSLVLDDAHKDAINRFVLTPLEYIKDFNPRVVDKYYWEKKPKTN